MDKKTEILYLHPHLPISHHQQIEQGHHSVWIVIEIEKHVAITLGIFNRLEFVHNLKKFHSTIGYPNQDKYQYLKDTRHQKDLLLPISGYQHSQFHQIAAINGNIYKHLINK